MSKYLETTTIKPARLSTEAAAPPKLDESGKALLRFLVAKAEQVEAMDRPGELNHSECEWASKTKALVDLVYGKETSHEIFIDDKQDDIDKASAIMQDAGEPVVASPGYSSMSLEEPKTLAHLFRSGRCTAAELIRLSTEPVAKVGQFYRDRHAVPAGTFPDGAIAAERATQRAIDAQLRAAGYPANRR